MSFIYSQALVAASLPANCLDTDACAPSNGSPTPKPSLWHDKTMDASRHSRFGMTCRPLTDDLGAALLTSWLEAFRVRTSPSRGGAGITGERSGMWKHMARIVGEVRPRYVFVENSPALITRGLGTVLSDLAALGYDCRWTVLGAADVGAPHQRDRFWLVGHAVGKRFDTRRDDHREHNGHLAGAADEHAAPLANADNAGQRASARGGCCGKCIASGHDAGRCSEAVADASCPRGKSKSEATNRRSEGNASQPLHCGSDLADAYGTNLEGGHRYDAQGWKESFRHVGLAGGISDWWEAEPSVGRVAHGVAGRVDRLKAIGNGQVPLCAATAWRLLNEHSK